MRRLRRSTSRKAGATVAIEAEEVRATTPEGAVATIAVDDLVERLAPRFPNTGNVILPDGVKALIPTANGLIAVHQTPPLVYNFRWIAPDSRVEHGPGVKYRQVRIALPYLVVLAVFEGRRVPHLSRRNECFFSNQPLENEGLDTPLAFPALLNCSRFPDGGDRPLAWICTQHLPIEDFAGRPDLCASLRAGLRALLHHLLESGFNLSSEHHELSSWYSESVRAGVDPRISTVEKWEEATNADPLFVLEVKWLPTGRTLGQIAERIASAAEDGAPRIRTADDVARVVLHGGVAQ
jgi:hypothetical protein